MFIYLARWILNACILLVIARFTGVIEFSSFWAAVVAVAVIGFISSFIRPILAFITFPITLLTFGLFNIVINASLFFLASYFVPGFRVNSFMSALIGSILYGLITYIIHKIMVPS